jgi:hypothetical protein
VQQLRPLAPPEACEGGHSASFLYCGVPTPHFLASLAACCLSLSLSDFKISFLFYAPSHSIFSAGGLLTLLFYRHAATPQAVLNVRCSVCLIAGGWGALPVEPQASSSLSLRLTELRFNF